MLCGKTVCVDLDGVLNLYEGWKGEAHFPPVRSGAREFLAALREEGALVVVFTVREPRRTEKWLREVGLLPLVTAVTNRKVGAHVYIDDRSVCFRGDFAATLAEVERFQPHWKEELTLG